MQIVEEQIVEKIRTLSDKEREDVLRYVDGVISNQTRPKKLDEKIMDWSPIFQMKFGKRYLKTEPNSTTITFTERRKDESGICGHSVFRPRE